MSGVSASNAEVVVVGGGPAGCATALSLASEGLDVLLVERSTYAHCRVGETFPPALQWVLGRLGLWDAFLAQEPRPSPGIRCIWGSDDAYERSFMFDPYGCGWHVDRLAFDALLASAAEHRGVRVLRGARVQRLDRPMGGDAWKLEIASSEPLLEVRTPFLVDATGRVAALGRRLGARRVAYDRLVGLYAFASGGYDEGEAATLLEATENGWWYSAPLPNDRFVFAYMTDADLSARARLGAPSRWRAQLELAPHTRARAARKSLEGKLWVQSANSSTLMPVAGAGWLAVGDAALAFDPLAGQGAYRALLAGINAASIIRSSRGGEDALDAYAAAAMRDFDRFLARRGEHYGREKRWASSPFWRRRSHAQDAVVSATPEAIEGAATTSRGR